MPTLSIERPELAAQPILLGEIGSCVDPSYLKMHVERLTEFASPGHDPAATFRAECAAALQR